MALPLPLPPPEPPPIPENQLPAPAPAPRPSLLDMLRDRVEGGIADERMRRVSDFGAGMLASGSPNFFTMLGAGARAQSEGERSRLQELRQLAEAERQAAAQRAEQAYREEQARIQSERYAQEGPERAARAELFMQQARALQMGGPGVGTTARLTASALRTAATQAEAAVNNARRVRAAELSRPPLTPDEEVTIWQTTYNRVLAGQNVPAPPGATSGPPAAPAAPAATIDPMGRPIQ